MSVERTREGRWRLRCDGDGCERIFSPRRLPLPEKAYDAVKELRIRAGYSGWRTDLGPDLCPEDRR
jgi:hypothetical protein